MIIETWLHQDINEPVKVNYLNGNLFTNNGNGNQINVLMTDKGEPVNITGTVSGYVVTADGSTVPCVGGASGNRAAVLIPAAAYQPGPIFITVFVTDGTQVTTIGAVSSTVLSSRTNAQVDPGSVVTDWTQTINAAMQAVQTAAANMSGIIAVPYASITFPVPLGKYTVYNDNLYRCITPIASSESFTAAHWTQVRLGDDVSDLKSALEMVIDGTVVEVYGLPETKTPTMTTGEYIVANGNAGSDAEYSHTEKIDVKEGQKIVCPEINMRFICAYYDNTPYASKGSNNEVSEYIVPEGINKIVVSVKTTSQITIKIYSIEYQNNEKENVDKISDILTVSKNLFNPSDATDNYYISYANGNLVEDSNYITSGFIPVTPGKTYYFSSYGIAMTARFYCLYNATKGHVTGGQDVTQITIPSGDYYIRYSYDKRLYSASQFEIDEITAYVPYAKSSSIYELQEKTAALIMSNTGAESAIIKGDLSTGNELVLPLSEIKKNNLFAFSCMIGTMGELNIGIKASESSMNYIKITSTNLDIVVAGHTYQNTHGLTLANDIQLQIYTNDAGSCNKVAIFSNGSVFETETEIPWSGTSNWNGSPDGIPFAKCVSGAYTGCEFSYGSKDLQRTLWGFGDSYFSIYNSARWCYYLVQNGQAKNVLLSGYGGENSENAIKALKSYLNNYKAMPRKIIWALGMNDSSDGSSAPALSWLTYVEDFIRICNQYNIEPILCTIPTVLIASNNTLRNHEKKNEWVRNSGYRYIDFAKAIGAQADGTWITGYCASDGVHPTEAGAKALYFRAITDCPELTFENN